MYAFAGLTCRCLDFRQTKLSSSETRGYADDQVSFDASLGFPGEGPLNSSRGFSNFWQMSCSQWISCWISSWIFHVQLPAAWQSSSHPSSCLSAGLLLVVGGCFALLVVAPVCCGFPFLSGVVPCRPREPCRSFLELLVKRSKLLRRLLAPVPQGRPVLPMTRKRGASRLDEFFLRAFEEGLDMIGMFEKHHI